MTPDFDGAAAQIVLTVRGTHRSEADACRLVAASLGRAYALGGIEALKLARTALAGILPMETQESSHV